MIHAALAASSRWISLIGSVLTKTAHWPNIELEQVFSSYSFRFPELSQPI